MADPRTGLPPLHEAWLPREHSLYRPRHGGRQLFTLICAVVFFGAPLAALAGGVRAAEFENRRLAEFPSIERGWAFLAGLSPWATDHLAFRQEAVQVADAVSRSVFGEPPWLAPREQTTGSVGIDTDEQAPQIAVPPVIEGRDGWMYFGDDVANRCRQMRSLEASFEQLRKLRDGVEASGRRFVVVVAPDKTTMLPQYLPESYPGKKCRQAVTRELWSRVAWHKFVLDLRPALAAWADLLGKPVYPKLDAHWSDEGGLAMTTAIADALVPGISGQWRVETGDSWRSPGDLPPLIGKTGEITGRHYRLRPDGVVDRAVPTPTDFTEYREPFHFTSATGTGTIPAKVALIGDSFTIRALRYLNATFSDITIIHATRLEKSATAVSNMVADSDAVVFEVVERSLAGGNHPLLNPQVVETLIAELARRPVR